MRRVVGGRVASRHRSEYDAVREVRKLNGSETNTNTRQRAIVYGCSGEPPTIERQEKL